jgi:DNA-binding CsgD family transcriptional regulator
MAGLREVCLSYGSAAGRTALPFFITTYPEAWANRYFERGYVNVDPVVAATVRGVTPFNWSTLFAGRSPEPDQHIVINEAREFRINNGLTVPMRGPDRALAEFSVTTGRSSREFDELWLRHRHYLSAFSYYLHETVLRDLYRPPTQAVVQLSPRERECLLWTAKGKTAWEISEILSISQDTVVQYLKSAQRKFGVYKKTHAVVKAILLGLITP